MVWANFQRVSRHCKSVFTFITYTALFPPFYSSFWNWEGEKIRFYCYCLRTHYFLKRENLWVSLYFSYYTWRHRFLRAFSPEGRSLKLLHHGDVLAEKRATESRSWRVCSQCRSSQLRTGGTQERIKWGWKVCSARWPFRIWVNGGFNRFDFPLALTVTPLLLDSIKGLFFLKFFACP